jgi:general transcription factor 3C polypeptide 3 (transcription factor C subunit 4)
VVVEALRAIVLAMHAAARGCAHRLHGYHPNKLRAFTRARAHGAPRAELGAMSERQRVERMLGEANIHFAYREFQQAVAMLLEVVRLAPGMPHPYQTLGLIYEEMGRPLKALKLFMMAAHLSGRRDAQQWRQLASLCIKHGELQQASYCLAKLTVLQPNDPDALYDRARLLVHLGQYKRAADVLGSLLEQRPTDAGIARRLAQCLYRLSQPEKVSEP